MKICLKKINIFVDLKLIIILHSLYYNNEYYGLIKPKSATLAKHIEGYTMRIQIKQISFFFFIYIEEY